MKKFLIVLLFLLIQNTFSYWQCYARNSYGIDYWGTGSTKYEASQRALFACQSYTDFAAQCWVTSWCDWK